MKYSNYSIALNGKIKIGHARGHRHERKINWLTKMAQSTSFVPVPIRVKLRRFGMVQTWTLSEKIQRKDAKTQRREDGIRIRPSRISHVNPLPSSPPLRLCGLASLRLFLAKKRRLLRTFLNQADVLHCSFASLGSAAFILLQSLSLTRACPFFKMRLVNHYEI